MHPCLIKIIQEIDEEENDENKNKEEEDDDNNNKNIKELNFNAIRIDQNTIKFMFMILPKTTIVSLKISNNNLEISIII